MLEKLGMKAKEAEKFLMVASSEKKNQALKKIADGLIENSDEIIKANKIDLENGEKNGMAKSMLDRLKLDKGRIEGMAKGVIDVATLPEPVGRILSATERPNGLRIEKVSTPIGVIAVIFEARPNVTSDAAALCLKSGNTVILRGGKEAINSNKTIAKVMRQAVKEAGMPEDVIQLVEDTSRESANELMKMNDYVDVLIPRGGAGLIQAVVKNATVPVIETGVGNCHIYIEKTADPEMAKQILVNAKTSRPSVCNAAESLLIDEAIAADRLPDLAAALAPFHVQLRGCAKTCAILPQAIPATEEDFYTEYNDYILSVKVVSGFDEAVSHINEHGTGHSEAIVTADYALANRFLDEIDAAAVYVNASTRFTDGNEFGFGAEIGISTQKLHARGPMGLSALTSTKYIIYGNGQIR